MSQPWKKTLTGCCDNGMFDCLKGFFCGCCMVGQNEQKIGIRDGWVIGCILAIFPCCRAMTRGKIREHYGIEGGFAGDCCVHCCCAPCAILQEAHEIDDRGTNAAAGAPAGQAMS